MIKFFVKTAEYDLMLKNQKPKILCVDDEPDNLDALERLFRAQFTVLRAKSGAEAISIIEDNQKNNEDQSICIVLTDQRMPAMTGVQLLSYCLQNYPDIIRILLTGYTDIQSIVDAVNSGQIYRYLTKPWDPVDLTNTCLKAAEKYYLRHELKNKNIELERALTELQSLDKAKNQFMILINHELKTPLTSIISFTDLLKETRLDEEQEVCVQRIKKSADRLQSLIQDSLIVVSQETNTLKIKKELISSEKIKLKFSTELEQQLKSKNQTVSESIEKVYLHMDLNYIQQILIRLIHNASKFGKENSAIQVLTKIENKKLIFQVQNEGTNLKSSVIEKITKPFFLDEDVMNHSVGTGLGLTVCQSLLKAHDSTLEFINQPSGVIVQFSLAIHSHPVSL